MYRYVLRKYELPQPQKTAYEARKYWEWLKEEKGAGLKDHIVDEFPIQDKPKGWLKSLVKQLTG